MNTDDKFIKRITELAYQSYNESRYIFSDFLNPAEQAQLMRLSGRFPVKAELFGGFQDAERRMARFGSADELGYEEDYPIAVLEVKPLSEKYGEELSHRDCLGALLNLGIDRRITGDIVISGKKAWIICQEHITGFIEESLTRIRHTSVCTVRVPALPDVAASAPAEAYIYVPSLRLDAVISKAFRMSRSDAQKYVAAEKVFVNSLTITSASLILKEGDLVSVRGYGRLRYTGPFTQTKKGNLRIRVEMYIKT